MTKVAFIGLGVMGYHMAGHLKNGGHDVTVYNRTASKATRWTKKFGGKSRKTPRDAAKGAEIVFTCVGNDDDLRAVTLGRDGCFQGMQEGSIFVDHTTASAGAARALYQAGAERGIRCLDAPVSGGQAGAENAAGGIAEAYPRVSLEWLIAARPEVILDATETSEPPAEYWARWPSLPAVAAGRVIAIPADEVTLPGPHLERGLRILGDALAGRGAGS